MKKENWVVTNSSSRPVGKPNECFYCGRKLGEEHKTDCVIRKKTVVVDFTIRMVVDVPEFWSKENIEFRFNEGTWCADNLLHMIDRKGQGCLCPYVHVKYIRDASEEDEEFWGLTKVKELKS